MELKRGGASVVEHPLHQLEQVKLDHKEAWCPWSTEEKKLQIDYLEMLVAFLAFKILLQTWENHQHPAKDGQHISSYVQKQDGRDGVPNSEQAKQGVLVMVLEERHLHQGMWQKHWTSLWIQSPEWWWGQIWLDAFTPSINSLAHWKRTYSPRGSPLNFLAFVSWRADPEAFATDTFTVIHEGLCQSSMEPSGGGKGSSPGIPAEGRFNFSGSSLEDLLISLVQQDTECVWTYHGSYQGADHTNLPTS